MSAKNTLIEPERPASADHTPKPGCCGGGVGHDTPTEAAMDTDHECGQQAEPSQAVRSSCGCGSSTPSRAAGEHDRIASAK